MFFFFFFFFFLLQLLFLFVKFLLLYVLNFYICIFSLMSNIVFTLKIQMNIILSYYHVLKYSFSSMKPEHKKKIFFKVFSIPELNRQKRIYTTEFLSFRKMIILKVDLHFSTCNVILFYFFVRSII